MQLGKMYQIKNNAVPKHSKAIDVTQVVITLLSDVKWVLYGEQTPTLPLIWRSAKKA